MKKLKVILISCLCLLMMAGCTTNKIDNQKINTFAELSGYINSKRPDDKVQVTFVRDGKTKVVPVTLVKKELFNTEFKGLELEDINSSDKKKYGIDYGVKIKDVTSDALKPYQNQLKGNIILKVDDQKATDVETISTFLNRKGEDKSISIQMINRMGQLSQVIIQ